MQPFFLWIHPELSKSAFSADVWYLFHTDIHILLLARLLVIKMSPLPHPPSFDTQRESNFLKSCWYTKKGKTDDILESNQRRKSKIEDIALIFLERACFFFSPTKSQLSEKIKKLQKSVVLA